MPPTLSSITIDLHGHATGQIELTPEQIEMLRAVLQEYRGRGGLAAASTFILGQLVLVNDPAGRLIHWLKFYVTPRKLGIEINRTIGRFFKERAR